MDVENLGPCPLCGGEAKDNSGTVSIRHVVWCPTCEGPRMDMQWWNRLSAMAADARRVEELLRENIQLRLEQSAQVVDTSEYRDLMEDRQKQVVTVFRLRSALERCRDWFLFTGKLRHYQPVRMAAMCEEALKK